MELDKIKNCKNVAIRINDLPFREEFMNSEKIRLALFSKGFDKNWRKLSTKCLVDFDEFFGTPFHFDLYQDTVSNVQDLLNIQKTILNSYNLYHVLDRNDSFSSKSLVEQDIIINEFIFKSIYLLINSGIDLLVIHDTPHSPDNYILFECANALKIPVVNIRQSPLPWCALIEAGLSFDSIPLKIFPSKESSSDLDATVTNYINSLSGGYDEAIPEYERTRFVKYKGNLWSWKKEIRRLLKYRFSIRYIKESIDKFRTLRSLESKSLETSLNERYVVFFLHYQPERTTLPEGEIYNQQLLAIQNLRMILPKDIKLIVREHPSTFRNKFIKKFRPDMFYNKISIMENVYLSSPLQDPFSLLDKSIFIATITGTIGVEAVIRGKCCVYFGNAVYKNMPGTFRINEIWQDRTLLPLLINNLLCPTKSQVKSYFKEIQSFTCQVHSYENSYADENAHLKNASETLLTLLQI